MSRFEFRIDVEAGDRPTESFEGVCLLDEAGKRKLACGTRVEHDQG